METIAIATDRLSKIYNMNRKNEVQALRDLNIRIKKGEIYGLLGENGAGKTTTVRILTTMIKATSGTASIFENDVVTESSAVRKMLGCLPQDAGLYEEFSAIENLDFIAKLRGLKQEDRKTQITNLIKTINLEERKNDRVETYSGGMKRRLMIARAMIGEPQVLFLDEPTAGIDVLVSRRVREIIKTLAKQNNITVLMSTHDMISAERICDRVGVLHKGVLIAEDTPPKIIQEYAGEQNDLEDAVVNLIGWTGDSDEVFE
ncbi:MAG: ABC transporter ATP-binding protein [Candidatus Heimdallarchaeota archaeon]|nr:MAG: ABC transporter ATP-binding protein [Candidatus Heimdallarchaeota archaeon]